jgi:type I restriction-modification system DNA methylase subunit
MMMRGDGKSNVYCGDCFKKEKEITDRKYNPSVAFLNFSYDVGTAGQMLFIEHALNMVSAQNGRVVAIVQMSCGIKNEKELIAVKKRILQKHHLKAVLSMPDDLFYPVGVVTCVMVFEANKKNEGRETWFGYFKDDKFEKRKNRGRIDARGLYKKEKKRWLNAYHNSKEVAGLSVKQEVKGEDEWCAEAYMETDYSKLNQADFEKKLKDYVAFKFLNEIKK